MAAKRKRPTPSQPEHEDSEDLDITDEPPAVDPYATLGVEKSATTEQVRSAYRRLALKHHPDKATEADKSDAHTKFQEIAAAYAILSDDIRRKRYDTTGRTDESFGPGEDGDFDWATFYREQYESTVSAERIEEFAKQYKGSDEEKDDVLAAYEKVKGDMKALYEEVMLSEPADDEERFRSIIDAAITSGDVESYPKYSKETAKSRQKRIKASQKNAGKEAKEAEELAEELGLKKKGKKKNNDISDLAALIKQRQNGRAESFFDNLEAKYGGGGKRSKTDEPSERPSPATLPKRRRSKHESTQTDET